MTTKEKAELLNLVSDYENTEIGDYWCSLTNLYNYSKDYMTEEYHLQTGVEIEIQYQYMLDLLEDNEFRNLSEELPEELKGKILCGMK